MWKNYELSSENLSSWLKDIEEKARQVTGTQVNLQTFEKEMHNLKDIQNELVSHVGDFKDLTNLSETIIAECSESRIEQQVSSINNRYNTVTKHLTKHMEKLQKIFHNKDLQKESIQGYEKWLKNSKDELQEFENLQTLCSDSKINDFKLIMANKENGSVLLEKAIESGENIFSEIAPSNRDKIRSEIRSLRDGWENHIDYMNNINKGIEALLLKKSSFEESFNQTQNWIKSASSKYKYNQEFGSNLAEKKSIQQSLRSLQQDLTSNETILNALKAKSDSVGKQEMKSKLNLILKTYEELKNVNMKNVKLSTEYVEEHERFNDQLEKARDLISNFTIELSVLAETPFEADETEKKIDNVNRLLQRKDEGMKLISDCKKILVQVVSHTSSNGAGDLNAEVNELDQKWSELIKNAALSDSNKKVSTMSLEYLSMILMPLVNG